MLTNLSIDDDLVKEAQKLGGHKTRRETVNVALTEYIKHRKQQETLGSFGSVLYENCYNDKNQS
ncbi:type II toxin-antitoxin system VapB family antitoxin [Endozoicomonas arenosclerae]|uniref:type II toxin-antitoxin system VapB family antitoxin n=1 Tax=Endozoicomonas arenosclerae TaxID=1633495 RepID=UPI00078466EE